MELYYLYVLKMNNYFRQKLRQCIKTIFSKLLRSSDDIVAKTTAVVELSVYQRAPSGLSVVIKRPKQGTRLSKRKRHS